MDIESSKSDSVLDHLEQDAKDWVAGKAFSLKPGAFYTNSLSIEKRRRILKKIGFHKKPIDHFRIPKINRVLTESFPGYLATQDKILSSIQRNEVDGVILSEALMEQFLMLCCTSS